MNALTPFLRYLPTPTFWQAHLSVDLRYWASRTRIRVDQSGAKVEVSSSTSAPRPQAPKAGTESRWSAPKTKRAPGVGARIALARYDAQLVLFTCNSSDAKLRSARRIGA